MNDGTRESPAPLGLALGALRSFAGSAIAERLALREPAVRLAGALSKRGFAAVNGAANGVAALRDRFGPERPARASEPPDVFDPTPSEDQRILRDSVRDFAEKEIRPAAAIADEQTAAPRALLEAAWALGIGVLAIPERFGGAGSERSPVASVLVAEELARGDMGIAVAALAPAGVAQALALWGTAEQQERWLPRFASEAFLPAALAIAEPVPLFDPAALRCRARPAGEGFRLDGTKTLVPLAEEAELLLVAAALEDAGPALFLVERGAAGVTASRDPGMGVRAAGLGTIELRDVRVERAARLGDGLVTYEEVVDLSRLAWSALAVGTGQAVLDHVIPYVNDRVAFGEPVSHRQSVAFLVANVAVELESMRLLVHRAASRAERGLPYHREAFLARIFAAEKGMEIGSSGVQLLGGHGFVKEHPVERWYRDLRAVGVVEGGVLA